MRRESLAEYLEKRAGAFGTAARFIGSNAMRTGLLGAAGGAAANVARERFNGRAEKHYGAAAAKGGVAGGLLGLAGQSVARRGLDAGLVLGKGATKGGIATETAKSYGRSLADFGKRQVHGFTGAMEGSMTNPLARQGKILKLRKADALRRGASGEASRVAGEITENAAQLKNKKEAVKAGVTSFTGLAKGLANDPKKLGKAVWKHNVGKGGVALGMAGMPLGLAGYDIASKGDESATGGLSRKQKLLKGVAQTAGGVATGGMSFIPGMVGWDLAERSVRPWTKAKHPELAKR